MIFVINLIVRSLITHKEAETEDDCQDAVQVNHDISRFAVADGATRSFFPKRWAELLVNHFCETSDFSLEDGDWERWLVPIQQKWYGWVEEKVKILNQYYLTNSFRAKDPAVSTFVGLEVNKTKREWQAIIIGDSCLFHKSSNEFKSYLIEKSVDFTSCPDVFTSYADKNYYDPKFIRDKFQTGDIFILATDALAKWILKHKEAGYLEDILDRLRKLESQEQFNEFVNQARNDANIRLVNDDVTFMIISVEENEYQGLSGTQTQNVTDEKNRENIVEIIFWGTFLGFLGFFACRGIFRFLRDIILTLVNRK